MDAATATHTHLLATYTADGQRRHVLALQHYHDDIIEVVSVLADPVDGDEDRNRIENRVTSLGEAQAIADDYIALAHKLGWEPMPGMWW